MTPDQFKFQPDTTQQLPLGRGIIMLSTGAKLEGTWTWNLNSRVVYFKGVDNEVWLLDMGAIIAYQPITVPHLADQ